MPGGLGEQQKVFDIIVGTELSLVSRIAITCENEQKNLTTESKQTKQKMNFAMKLLFYSKSRMVRPASLDDAETPFG